MFGLDNLFAQASAQKFNISRDRIAEILRVSPDALDAFEKASIPVPSLSRAASHL